jgi:plasmid stabilization system protein ParE
MPNFSVRPSALEDIHRALDYFDEINPTLSVGFLEELRAVYHRIKDHPEGYQKRYGQIRIALLKRFSFGVFYKIYDTRIVVIAVLHTSQDSDKWLQRRGK